MSDSEGSPDEGFLVKSTRTNQIEVTDPFAIAHKNKKVTYGSFASMSTLPILCIIE